MINVGLAQARPKKSNKYKLGLYTSFNFMCYNCRFGLDTEYPITLDNVDCSTSNYLTILQCGYSTFISSSCDHGMDDVSVTCCELLTDNDYLANKLMCIYPRSAPPNRCNRTVFGYATILH